MYNTNLPSNVVYAVQDALEEITEGYIDKDVDVEILPSQRASFEGLYVEFKGAYILPLKIVGTVGCDVKITAANEDGKEFEFEINDV